VDLTRQNGPRCCGGNQCGVTRVMGTLLSRPGSSRRLPVPRPVPRAGLEPATCALGRRLVRPVPLPAGKLDAVKWDELLLLLGKVTANGQSLEMVTCQVLGRCLRLPGDDRVAIRFGQQFNIARRLDLIAELSNMEGCPLDPAKVREWVAVAKPANERRNIIIHSGWMGDPATGEFRGALTKSAREEPSWGERELQEAIDRLRNAIEKAIELLGLPFTPSPDGGWW